MESWKQQWDDVGEELVALPVGEGLQRGVQLLDREIRSIKVRRERILTDAVASDFALQVLEAGKGVATLTRSEAQRMAYPLARRGFEALHELFTLLVESTDPNAYAADAFVRTMFSVAESRHGLDRAVEGIGQTEVRELPPTRSVVRDAADEIGGISPPARQAILDALAKRDRKGGKKRLDGSRGDRLKKLAVDPEFGPMGQKFLAYWGALSLNAHPHVRLGSAVQLSDGTLRLHLQPVINDEGPQKVALATTYTAARICSRYLRPDLHGRDQGG